MIPNKRTHMLSLQLAIFAVLCCVAGCFSDPPIAGEFLLDKKSPMPQWFDAKESSETATIKLRYTLYDTVFTSKGKATVEISSPEKGKLMKLNGTWEWMPGEGGPQLKEGDPSLVLLTFRGISEVYEFRHLSNVIAIVRKEAPKVGAQNKP